MPLASQLAHRFIANPALPYDVRGNPISREPVYVGGENVLTSDREFAERRPGFGEFETTATTFTGTIRRSFAWRRWAASFYVMANEVTATQSIVYKREIGVDASFVSLFTSSSTEPFDFIVSNNHVFFGNGTDMRKWDGTTITNWGIVAPAAAPTVATSGTGITAVSGFQYVYTYGNAGTGHQSSPSGTSLSTGSFTDDQVDVTVVASSDAQVDEIHIYRTTDGGGGIKFEITGSPFANASTSYADTTADADLSSTVAPEETINDPPPAAKGFVWWNNRIWMFVNNRVWYTGWEEIVTGVEEECVPSGSAGNFWDFESEVSGISKSPEALLVFAGSGNVHRIEGDTRDTFSRKYFLSRLSTRERATIATMGRLTAWLDISDSVYITDGFQVQEIATDILPDLDGIDHAQASIAIHNDGQRKWLMLLDGGKSRLRVYDFETEQWMPPWTVGGRAIHSGETSIGAFDLLVGHTSSKVLKLTPGTYQDNAVNYLAHLITSASDITTGENAGHLGALEYVSLERNSVALSNVQAMTDDDPTTGNFVPRDDLVASPLRVQGTNLLEDWAYFRKPAARRAAVRFDWAAANSNFKLFSIDLAHKVMQ